ncbi:Protein CBG06093 [Caenorhabditis briggsae]|uniref:Protein CBG06093 n=1 Tax=Caenorhabditis briggsae TaxID=6238 RepID=A8X0X4_CAEBR|nr:Protein CBG06093 [Caenorhabditis briggsae]CAP26284.1 Protein CBG06093 [Caenorhabditis briggsae]
MAQEAININRLKDKFKSFLCSNKDLSSRNSGNTSTGSTKEASTASRTKNNKFQKPQENRSRSIGVKWMSNQWMESKRLRYPTTTTLDELHQRAEQCKLMLLECQKRQGEADNWTHESRKSNRRRTPSHEPQTMVHDSLKPSFITGRQQQDKLIDDGRIANQRPRPPNGNGQSTTDEGDIINSQNPQTQTNYQLQTSLQEVSKTPRSFINYPISFTQRSSTVTGTTNGGTMDGSKNRKMMMHSTLVRHGAAIEQLLLGQETSAELSEILIDNWADAVIAQPSSFLIRAIVWVCCGLSAKPKTGEEKKRIYKGNEMKTRLKKVYDNFALLAFDENLNQSALNSPNFITLFQDFIEADGMWNDKRGDEYVKKKLEKDDIEGISNAWYSPNGSRIWEKLMETCSEDSRSLLWLEFCSKNVSELTDNKFSNFPLQKIINSSTSLEMVTEIVESMSTKLSYLIDHQHSGVFLAFIRCAGRHPSSEKSILQQLRKHFRSASEAKKGQFLLNVLTLNKYDGSHFDAQMFTPKQNSWETLITDTYGSRVFEKIWSFVDVKRKQEIMKVLVEIHYQGLTVYSQCHLLNTSFVLETGEKGRSFHRIINPSNEISQFITV